MKKKLLSNLMAVVLLLSSQFIYGQAPNLGSAQNFAVFTAVGAFNVTGVNTLVTGDVGTNVGAFNGFPPGVLIGQIHVADVASAAAAADVAIAYGSLSAVTCGQTIPVTMGNGDILFPDVYCTGAASTINGDLILDAQGDPNAIFIFKIDGALATSVASSITLINGASLCNVFWQINGQVDLGENSIFRGTTLVNGAVNLLDGATLIGQVLSQSGAVSLQNNLVTIGETAVASAITANSTTSFCTGDSVTLTGNVDGVWNTGAVSSDITVYTSGDFFVTNTTNCNSEVSNIITVSVNPLPVCSISGIDTTCPGEPTELCSPTGQANYLWSTGDTTACIFVNSTGTFSVTITDVNGCISSCSQDVTFVCNPVITPVAPINLLACNAVLPTLSTSWTDCSTSGNITGVAALQSTVGCVETYVYTFSGMDACGDIFSTQTTVTRTIDVSDPIITQIDDYQIAGCNQPWPATLTTDWSDNCSAGGDLIGTAGSVMQNGCTESRVYTFSVTDDCGNSSQSFVTITRVFDETPPIIINPADFVLPGCNPDWPTEVQANWTDNCAAGGSIIGAVGEMTDDGCSQSLTYNFSVTDDCGNETNALTIVTRSYTAIIPQIVPIADFQLDGCNQDWPVLVTTWTSDCSGGGNVTGVPGVISDNGCLQSRIYTFTVNDNCGLSTSSLTLVSRIFDETNPVIVPNVGDLTFGCNPTFLEPTFEATDNCGVGDVIVTTSGPTGPLCSRTQTWLANVQDNCGNLAIADSVTYNWIDNDVIPVITQTSGALDGAALGCSPTVVPPTFESMDNCLNVIEDVIPTTAGPQANGTCGYTQTWTANYSDGCLNNAAEVNVTYTWIVDTEDPKITQFTGAADGTDLGCNPTVVPPTFLISDNCLNVIESVIPTTTGPQANGTCVYTQTWTANYSDGCLNNATEVNVTYTWTVDQDAPIISFVNDMLADLENGGTLKIQCYGQDPTWSLPTASVNDVSVYDECAGNVDIVVSEVLVSEGDCKVDGYIDRFKCSWTATDSCGNTATLFIYMEVVDTIAPVIIDMPEDMTVACDEVPNAPNLKATDECKCAYITMTESLVTSECLTGEVIERTWTAKDCCGNVSISTQTITLIDDTPPILTVTLPDGTEISDNLILEFDCNEGGIPSEYLNMSALSAQATEVCSGTPSVSFNSTMKASTNCIDGALEVYSFVWTSYDACLNQSTITLKVRVVDTLPPIIMNLEDRICENGGDLPFIYAYDDCSNTLLQYYDVQTQGGCGNEFIRHYTATDACGNMVQKEQIFIKDDFIAPGIVLINPLLKGIESGDTIIMNYDPQADGDFTDFGIDDALYTDECNLPLNTSYSEELVLVMDCTEGNAIALIKMTWSAQDACDNIAQITLFALLTDTEAPVFNNFKAEFTVSCTQEIPEVIITDNSGEITIIVDETIVSGGCPGSYQIIRVIHAEDECGNVLDLTQTIHVIDITGPVIEGVEPFLCEDLSIPKVIATDACNLDIIPVTMVQDTFPKENCASELVIRRIWSATDSCGNTTEVEQIISFNDITPPTLIYNSNVLPFLNTMTEVKLSDIPGMAAVNGIEWYDIISYDECGGQIGWSDLTITSEFAEECEEAGYFEIRTFLWYFVEVCGNNTIVEFKVKIIDDVAPQLINVPESVDYGCLEIPAFGNFNGIKFDDLIDSMNGTITFDFTEELINGLFVVTNTWTATDECGNVTEASQILTEIVESDFSSSISADSDIMCNSHNNLVTAVTEGGEGPFEYEWTIIGGDCQIQGGQGTQSIYVYVGFHSVTIKLKVTDANNCESYSEYVIDCIAKGGIGRSDEYELEGVVFISQIAPNPTSDRIVMSVISTEATILRYTLLNTMNEIMLTNRVDITELENTFVIDVINYPAGIYYILIDNGTSSDIKRFVKLR